MDLTITRSGSNVKGEVAAYRNCRPRRKLQKMQGTAITNIGMTSI